MKSADTWGAICQRAGRDRADEVGGCGTDSDSDESQV